MAKSIKGSDRSSGTPPRKTGHFSGKVVSGRTTEKPPARLTKARRAGSSQADATQLAADLMRVAEHIMAAQEKVAKAAAAKQTLYDKGVARQGAAESSRRLRSPAPDPSQGSRRIVNASSAPIHSAVVTVNYSVSGWWKDATGQLRRSARDPEDELASRPLRLMRVILLGGTLLSLAVLIGLQDIVSGFLVGSAGVAVVAVGWLFVYDRR